MDELTAIKTGTALFLFCCIFVGAVIETVYRTPTREYTVGVTVVVILTLIKYI